MSTIALQGNENNFFTPINNVFIDNYMAGAHGDYIKVYIYLTRLFSSSDKTFDTSNVSKVLNITESDVIKAIKYWNNKGLINVSVNNGEIKSIKIAPIISGNIDTSSVKNETSNIVPFKATSAKKSYDKDDFDDDTFDKYSNDSEFSLFVKIVSRYFNKTLNVNDIAILIDLVDKKNMSYDILELIVEHLANSGITSVKALENKCITLIENNIDTFDKAKNFMKNSNTKHSKIFKKLMPKNQITPIVEDDMFIVDKWIYDYKMPYDLIYLACDRTNKFLKSKNLNHKINYCNKIIENWHHKGIKSVEAANLFIATNDSSKKYNKKKKNFGFEQHDYDFDAINRQNLKDLEERVKGMI